MEPAMAQRGLPPADPTQVLAQEPTREQTITAPLLNTADPGEANLAEPARLIVLPALLAPPAPGPSAPAPNAVESSDILQALPLSPGVGNDEIRAASKEAKPDAAKEEKPVQPEKDPTQAQADVPSTAPTPAEHPSLEVAELRLCRKVIGFGSFETLDATALKAGHPLLVYCEMTGLEYEARGDDFVSRLASHIEIRSEGTGSVVWEQAPRTAEDVCRRRRRDYYVNYLIELPKTLEPGSYRLRLIQTDLVGNRTTSKEIPLQITL
jgi:hypothetical protein